MHQTSTFILLLISSLGIFAKYVFIDEKKDWVSSRRHCQTFHSDLAIVSDKEDIDELMKLTGNTDGYIWLGMRRRKIDKNEWKWCGGVTVSFFFWASGEPTNGENEFFAAINDAKIYDVADTAVPFLCYRAIVIREKKTWEEAWKYCSIHHKGMASVASEAEMLLIQRELAKNSTTEHVWIGLHYFPGDGWLWTDNRPVKYEAWGSAKKPECPHFKMECSALKLKGQSDNTIFGSIDIQATDTDVGNSVWEAHDCEDRLHFICY